MPEQLQKQLHEKWAELKSIQLAASRLLQLEAELKATWERIAYLDWVAHKEYLDIEVLEKISISGLFQRILGTLDQQLEIERQEYLEAVLALKDAKASIVLLEFEMDVLRRKVQGKAELEASLNQLLHSLEIAYQSHSGEKANEIRAINRQIQDLVNFKREVYEAGIAAARCKKQIEQILKHLNAIGNMNFWLDASYETALALQTRGIQETLPKVKMNLTVLERELADVMHLLGNRQLPEIRQSQYLSNTFFQNLITDWLNKYQVHHAINQMEALMARVNRIALALERETQTSTEQMALLEKEKEALLLR